MARVARHRQRVSTENLLRLELIFHLGGQVVLKVGNTVCHDQIQCFALGCFK